MVPLIVPQGTMDFTEQYKESECSGTRRRAVKKGDDFIAVFTRIQSAPKCQTLKVRNIHIYT
jgi:hypothetical protein